MISGETTRRAELLKYICQNYQLQLLHFSQTVCQCLYTNEKWYCDTKQVGKIRWENSYRGDQPNKIFKKDTPTHCTAFVIPAYNFFWSRATTENRSPSLLDMKIQNMCKDMQEDEGMTDDGFYYPSEALRAGSSASISRKVVRSCRKVDIDEKNRSERNVDVECSSASIIFSGKFQNYNFQNKWNAYTCNCCPQIGALLTANFDFI